MSNVQDMSPDFVLMRLVSAAEDDRLDEENGNVSSGSVMAGLGKKVLTHSNMKGSLEFTRDPIAGLANSSHPSSLNNAHTSCGTTAPDMGVMATRPLLSIPPSQLSATEAQGLEFSHRSGLGPQLLVFPNILRDGEGILDRATDRRNHPRDQICFDKISGSASDLTGGSNNNTFNAGDVQQQNNLAQSWGLHPQVTLTTMVADIERSELCHRHRFITNSPNWPLLSDESNPFTVIESKWDCTTTDRERSVFDLARRFGELGVGAVPKMLFKNGELLQCSCPGAHGSAAAGMGPRDDPTETSDALLVLEGLGTGDVSGLGMDNCPEDESDDTGEGAFLLNRKREIVQKMSGTFSQNSFQVEFNKQGEGVASRSCFSAHQDPQVYSLPNPNGQATSEIAHDPELPTSPVVGLLTNGPNSNLGASPNTSQASTPRRRPDRCPSVPRTPPGQGNSEDKTFKVPGKSRKGSLKICLSKLFRTKSCSGSNNLLDKRQSVAYSITSAGSLMDMASASGGEQDVNRLTRPQSAFSPASFSAFTDDIGGQQPVPFLVSVVGASLQSLPLPLPPPPSHATIQHSISLNDAFLRVLPYSHPSQIDNPHRLATPPILFPLRRPEASNFTASIRELEKCGWYWGPMNWEDAEMKLKGKPDGSFLVRDSSDPRYILSLSFRSQGVTHHTRMEHYRGTFSLWCHPKFEDRCHSVVEFIERAIMHSKNGKFLYFLRSRVPGLPPTPVQLLYPVSRFSNVKSLQHLCRFCIRQMVRIDHIQELPLPKPLISYLRKFYYYDPEEEMYLSIKNICPGVGIEQDTGSQT
ncbi:suppressor of cytokine signaling 7 isoform X2 [Hypomesus transpacificus]|uniref:suppressor of cytokine signaling 7 isoform X2 n=1 Tax=Hypomesus transpacificus TaxID=137520 RepID=UPI001F07B052|nr:suppressor of cytokine signaling 7 isoform X2 [Hypomesus transpacificus]